MRADFKPRLREDGTFDPDCLEEAGLRWVKEWLRNRLSGQDPYFPIDDRYDEDPEALIVSILRDAGTVHPGSILLSRAVLELLDGARAAAPVIPEHFESLLSLCRQVRLPQTSSWFSEEVAAIASDPEAAELRWGGFDAVKRITQAAILQAPGIPHATSSESWLDLLGIPRYATLAWLGLAQSFSSRLAYLEDWYSVCPEEDRQRELDHLIFLGLKTEGEEEALSRIAEVSRNWPPSLESGIDAALRKNGATELFANQEDAFEEALRQELHRVVLDAAERLDDDPLTSRLEELSRAFEEMREAARALQAASVVEEPIEKVVYWMDFASEVHDRSWRALIASEDLESFQEHPVFRAFLRREDGRLKETFKAMRRALPH